MSTYQHSFSNRAKPLSVIVADDVLEIQHLVQLWLTEVGCEVACASSGREAIRLINERLFDVIVTDVLMPDGDGVEVIAELKRTQPTARVLAISGGGHHLKAIDCLKIAKGLGANVVLLKPFNREQLLEAVCQLAAPTRQPLSQRASGSARGV